MDVDYTTYHMRQMWISYAPHIHALLDIKGAMVPRSELVLTFDHTGLNAPIIDIITIDELLQRPSDGAPQELINDIVGRVRAGEGLTNVYECIVQDGNRWLSSYGIMENLWDEFGAAPSCLNGRGSLEGKELVDVLSRLGYS